MRKDITYKSNDNITNIYAVMWIPEVPIKAILQISHSMTGHITRFEKLAKLMNDQGILVCGNDQLGHGRSVIDKEHYGYFVKKNATDVVVEDLNTLTDIVKKDYPNVPYYVLGHSMGSFIVRNYITKYSDKITGTILTGTGHISTFTLTMARIVTTIIQFYHRGWFYRSLFLEKKTTGRFAKYFGKNADRLAWLTSDKNLIEEYNNDPYTHFRFTCNGYYSLFGFMKDCNNKKRIKNIRPDLPILMLSGKDDPVSHFGKDLDKIKRRYENLGLKKVKTKTYNNMRHEILKERDYIIVYNDILNFIDLNRLNIIKK